MFTLMCDIFIMCFVLFLFLTYFGLNFNVMAAASGAENGGEGRRRRRRRRRRKAAAAQEEEVEEESGGCGGLFGCNYD